MSRLNCAELHDRAGCPSVLREGITDYLGFFAAFSGIRNPAYRVIAARLRETGRSRLIELCAGSGFAGLRMLRKITALRSGTPPPELVLTDLYPSRNWERIRAMSPDVVLSAEPCEARAALRKYDGVFVMFAALHHFSPEEIISLLREAAASGKDFYSFDYFHRGRPAEWLLAPCSVVMLLLTTPLIFPFSWKRLFFTYAIPLIPAVLLIDGILSQWRSYTVEELNGLIRERFPDPPCELRARILPVWGGIAHLHELSAVWKKEAIKSAPEN